MSIDLLAKYSSGPYNGRDKFAKCLQFGSRFIAYHILLNDPKNAFALKCVLLNKQLAVARKGLRLGKSIEEVKKLKVAVTKQQKPVDLILSVVSTTGMIFRWAYDNLSFLEKAKIIEKADYGVTSNKYRVLSTVAFIIQCFENLMKANAACEASKGDSKAEEKANAARLEAFFNFFARLCDMVNAVHSAKYYTTNDGIQGACGFISSANAVRKVIKAMK